MGLDLLDDMDWWDAGSGAAALVLADLGAIRPGYAVGGWAALYLARRLVLLRRQVGVLAAEVERLGRKP